MSQYDRIVKVYENQLNAAKRNAVDMTQARVDRETIRSNAEDAVEAEVSGHWALQEAAPWAAARYLKSAVNVLQHLKDEVDAAHEVELVALEELRSAFADKRRFETFIARKDAEERRQSELKAGRRLLERGFASEPPPGENDLL